MTDVKDLLRRMLAPIGTRASLDLVLFHPWLKQQGMDSSIACLSYSNYSSHSGSHRNITMQQQDPPTAKCKPFKPLLHLLTLIAYGPYRPPKGPYRELASLHL